MMRATALLMMAAGVAADILTLSQLSSAISTGANKKVGFLSQGNYETVHDVLPNNTDVVIVGHSNDLEDMVANGTLLAGLVSGVPTAGRFVTFSSTLISPRAMFVKASLEEHIDAAIVRVLSKGLPQTFAAANPPFEMVTVFSCKGVPASFPFPTQTITTPVKIGALGPSNWGSDGNYLATPPTGYWPDYYNAIEAEFRAVYGVGFERVWYSSSADVMAALANGTIDATEPYWTVDSFYQGRGRKHLFEMSCITMGYDSTFFTRLTATQSDNNDGIKGWVLAIIIVISVLFAVALGFGIWLIVRERSGNPAFQPLAKTDTDKEMGDNEPNNYN